MTSVLRAADRFETIQPGIRTWHAFSAGQHYDPDNVAHGPVIGCDEHLVDPGAGFDWHAHRGVVIVSWVLAGTLRHEDDAGGVVLVVPGEVLVQSTGDGIRHRETNPSDSDPLRFVQTAVLLDLDRFVRTPTLPTSCGDVSVTLVEDAGQLQPGDSKRDERTFAVASSEARLVVDW